MPKNKKLGKKLQTIYEYFSDYTEEEINIVISKLSDEDRQLIKLRYGDDLKNPITSELWNEDYQKRFYGSLIPKMRKLLFKQREKNISKEKLLDEKISVEKTDKKVVKEDLKEIELTSENNKKESSVPMAYAKKLFKKDDRNDSLDSISDNKKTNASLEKEDYIRILQMMRTPSFEDMLKVLSPKEAIIICLKLGYVDDKYFTTESIAGFLGIDEDEVRKITNKVLLVYREKLNNFIDTAIDITTNKTNILKK